MPKCFLIKLISALSPLLYSVSGFAQTPLFSKNFGPGSILVAENSTLTFTIDNSAAGVDATALNFVDVLPAGLQVAWQPDVSTTCMGGTISATPGTDTISYTGGAVPANGSCTLSVDVYGLTAGVKNNVSGDLTSSEGNSGPAADNLTVTQADVFEWILPGTGDWYTATNWDPNMVPSFGDVAIINNGGVAETSIVQAEIGVHGLNVGISGGDGTLLIGNGFESVFAFGGEANIGVTFTGSDHTTGTVQFGDEVFGALSGAADGPLRVGVTQSGGDATGHFDFLYYGISFGTFGLIQIGVSDGAGKATGTFGAPRGGPFWPSANNSFLEVGVARSSGAANGTLRFPVSGFSDVHVGVAGASGNASGLVFSRAAFSGTPDADLRGEAWIGVSNGDGTAEGVVNMEPSEFGFPVDNFNVLNIGVAAGAASASGILRTSVGIDVPEVNVGLSTGGGPASGLVYVDHGLLRADELSLGPASTLELAAYHDVRATNDQQIEVYSAVNVGSATIAGDLVLDLQYLPATPTVFEIINSGAVDGIDELFDSVTVNHLPNGFTVSQSLQLDGSNNEQLIVELLGEPVLPNWTNPNSEGTAGNWFDGANWSTGLVPGANEPPVVDNGGEAIADIGTAPGPVVGSAIAIGKDGGNGIFSSNGVDVEADFSFLLGQVSPFNLTEQASTGTATVTDADVIVQGPGGGVSSNRTLIGIGIGVAQGSGTSFGEMTITNGSLVSGKNIYVGAALPVADGATPTATGELIFNGGGTETSQIFTRDYSFVPGDLNIALADDSQNTAVPALSATASAVIDNATIDSDVVIANVFMNNENAIGEATATSVELSDVVLTDDLEISTVISSGTNSQSLSHSVVNVSNATFEGFSSEVGIARLNVSGGGASGTITSSVDMSDISFSPNAAWNVIGEVSAEGGASASSTSTTTIRRMSLNTRNGFLIGFADAASTDSQATSLTTLSFEDSDLSVEQFRVGDFEAGNSATAIGNAEVSFESGTISGARMRIGVADVFDTSLVDAEVSVEIRDSTVNLTDLLQVGDVQVHGSNEDSFVSAELRLSGSSLYSDMIWMDTFTAPAGTLEALLELDSSMVGANTTTIGVGSSVNFHIDGLTRIESGLQGQPGLYAAINTNSVQLFGPIVATFDFIPPAGTHVFDLIVTGENGIFGSVLSTFTVENLDPGFSIDFFGVVEEETEIVRLQISGTPTILFSDGFEVQ